MMEPHNGKPSNYEEYSISSSASSDDLFEAARAYAIEYHMPTVDFYRKVSLDKTTASYFWSEYIWCVYTSGFKASIVTKMFRNLMDAYGPVDWNVADSFVWERVRPVFGNHLKFEAICKCRTLLRRLGWDDFKKEFCCSPDDLQQLPFIGKITKFHLARNLGMDCCKPDLHLVRLATHFKFGSPEELCSTLAKKYRERIGVVDFMLWSWSAAIGTKEFDHEATT